MQFKKKVLNVLIEVACALVVCITLICISYCVIKGISFSINGNSMRFKGLTYGDLNGIEVQPNSVFIVISGEEQVDLSAADFEADAPIKSITAIVTNANDTCDFQAYDIHVGESGKDVVDKMPKEAIHTVDENTDVRLSKYVDKDNNVLIVGTDVELDIVSYITIRIRE